MPCNDSFLCACFGYAHSENHITRSLNRYGFKTLSAFGFQLSKPNRCFLAEYLRYSSSFAFKETCTKTERFCFHSKQAFSKWVINDLWGIWSWNFTDTFWGHLRFISHLVKVHNRCPLKYLKYYANKQWCDASNTINNSDIGCLSQKHYELSWS